MFDRCFRRTDKVRLKRLRTPLRYQFTVALVFLPLELYLLRQLAGIHDHFYDMPFVFLRSLLPVFFEIFVEFVHTISSPWDCFVLFSLIVP